MLIDIHKLLNLFDRAPEEAENGEHYSPPATETAHRYY
jgi:hypothetical protein